MIKNPLIFYAALLFVALGAMARHGEIVDNFFGFSHFFVFLPNAMIWAGAAAVLIIVSMIPNRQNRQNTNKANLEIDTSTIFVKHDLENVASSIDALTSSSHADIPLIVDYIIFQAIAAKASDIHFDPGQNSMNTKLRIEGMMTNIASIKKEHSHPIINRLKVLSNLIIYKGATPQDGRLEHSGKNQKEELRRSGLANADFRISCMPTLHGERIVIRILAKNEKNLDLEQLGMDEYDRKTIQRILEQPQGMVILTGPTGSGKSTTIYAALKFIQTKSNLQRSIATLEDPIEFDLDGINQSQVDEQKNFTFNKGLRAILRQDPDVIMVGEIRDAETAKISIQAGMTGHLVITTVHAGSSAAAFSRLVEMGIAPYSLNSSVTAIVAQRLVRKICPHCKKERGFTEHDLQYLNMATPLVGFKLYNAMGCEQCEHSGFMGRIAIYEILEVTESIRKLVNSTADTKAIQQHADDIGMRTLWQSGLHAIKNGLTTPEELSRVITKKSQ